MLVRVAINGLGRIGRLVLKAGIHDKRIKFVAVNDLTDAKTLAHLLKHDSVYGPWKEKIEITKDNDLKISKGKWSLTIPGIFAPFSASNEGQSLRVESFICCSIKSKMGFCPTR